MEDFFANQKAVGKVDKDGKEKRGIAAVSKTRPDVAWPLKMGRTGVVDGGQKTERRAN